MTTTPNKAGCRQRRDRAQCPYKGVTYESMRSKHTMSNSDPELYRTFGKDWWNFYRWFDYATHPRWQLPPRSPTAEQ